MKQRAFYGDMHGCYDELVRLHKKVQKKYPGIEHWHVGDLIDRGPNNGELVDFVMKHFQGGVKGNHEQTLVRGYKNCTRFGHKHRNPMKQQTLEQLKPYHIEYLDSLPYLYLFDDIKLAIVHGGLYPTLSWHEQVSNGGGICRLQMIKPGFNMTTYKNRWWGQDSKHQPKIGQTEEQSRKEGFVRWYEVWDGEYDVIYGHSVLGLKPFIYQNEDYGKTIGIDTGSCFGGRLTAYIYPACEYEQEQCKQYVEGKNVAEFNLMESEND